MKKTKKFEPRFARTRRGYDIDAVEAFITSEQNRADDALREQKERIAALKAENAKLSCELDSLRAREEQIKTTLVSATEKADKMTLDLKLRYAMELDRLKLFRAKWTQAYEEMKERYHFSKDALNMESVAVSTELEIQKFLSQDFSLTKGDDADKMESDFKGEAARLTPARSGAEELKAKLLEAEEKKNRQQQKQVAYTSAESGGVAFSLEDALAPKESLADICRYLGLNATV